MPSKSCQERTSPRPAFEATTSSKPARASTSTRSKPRATASDSRRRRARWSRSGKRPPSDSGRQVKRIGFVRACEQGGEVEVAHEVGPDLEEVGDGGERGHPGDDRGGRLLRQADCDRRPAALEARKPLRVSLKRPSRPASASPGNPLWRRTPEGPPLRVPVMEHGTPAAHGSAAIGPKGRVRARGHVSIDSQTDDFRGAARRLSRRPSRGPRGRASGRRPRLSAAPRAHPARTSLGQWTPA